MNKPLIQAFFTGSAHYGRGIFLLLLALGTLSSCNNSEVEGEAPVRPVRYLRLEASSQQEAAIFTGETKSGQEANLSFKVGGVVEQVRVENGQRVSRGQLIASLDTEDYALQVDQAKVQVKQAQTSLNVAKSTYDRVERLYESNSVSLSEYEQAKGNYEASQAQLSAARQQVKAAENQLSYTRLTSPFSGVISNLNIEEGELVGVGNPVATLSMEGEAEAEVGLPDRYIGRVRKGMPVSIRLSAFPDRTFEGEVIEISYSQNSSTTYPVRARFVDPKQDIRPGLSAELRFDFRTQKDDEPLVLPANAVGEDAQGRRFVFALQGQGDTLKVEQRYVEVGELGPEGFVLEEGLSPGDLIATAGLRSLLPGMKVRLLE